MHSVCIVDVHVTVNNIKILSVAQQCFLCRIYAAGNNETYLGLNVKCPIFLSDFNQIGSFTTDFHKCPQYQISRPQTNDGQTDMKKLVGDRV